MNMDSANAASAASPKQRSSLGLRVLSAAVLLPLIILLAWWSRWTVAAAVALAALIALAELYEAFAHGGFHPRYVVGFATVAGLVGAATLRPYVGADALALVLMLSIIGSLLAEMPRHSRETVLPHWALSLAGALYIGWLFSHAILLRDLATPLRAAPLSVLHLDPGVAWLFTVMAITWLQDTGAYFAGRAFGRHRMAPILSPKKTWEGAIGGLVGAMLGGMLGQWLLGLPVSLLVAALLGLVGGVLGPLGDLAESLIKRQVGLKDIGRIIPGHGGVLDRADSLLFTMPVLYYLIRLFTS